MTDVDDYVTAMTSVLESGGYRIDPDAGGSPSLESWRAAQADCLLPVFARLAEELWRSETNGSGFGLLIEVDPLALVGYRLTGAYHVPLSILVVATDEILRRVANDDRIITLDALQNYAAGVA